MVGNVKRRVTKAFYSAVEAKVLGSEGLLNYPLDWLSYFDLAFLLVNTNVFLHYSIKLVHSKYLQLVIVDYASSNTVKI